MVKNRSFRLPIIALIIAGLVLTACGTMNLFKAEIKMTQGKYNEAIPIYKLYATKNPKDVEVKNRLGFAYFKTNQLGKAEAVFKSVLSIKPGDPYSTLYLGMVYLNRNKFDKAASAWQGYRAKGKPLVEKEIKKLLTLVRIMAGRQEAKQALAREKAIHAANLDSDTIAVCYYKDISQGNSLKGFQKGLAAMVISDLSKIKSLKVVERIRLQTLFQEIKLGQTGIVDEKTAPRIGKLVGAESLVVGSMAEGIQVITSLASASMGKVRGSASVTIPKDNFFEIPKNIVLQVAKIKGITLSNKELSEIGIPQTKSYKALAFYSQALDAMDAGNWKQSKDLFALSLQEDPNFMLARDGHESCPDSSSPNMGMLSTMENAQFTKEVESSIANAEKDQNRADKAAEAAAKEAGKGGGGY